MTMSLFKITYKLNDIDISTQISLLRRSNKELKIYILIILFFKSFYRE